MIESETLVIGESTFTISPLPATKAWDLSLFVANAIGTTNVGDLNLSGAAEAVGVGIFKAVAALPAPSVMHVRNELFEHIDFTCRLNPQPMKLRGMEDQAFNAMGLSSLDIWRVFAVAFKINFTEYWDLITSQLPRLQTMLPSQPSDSPASSPL